MNIYFVLLSLIRTLTFGLRYSRSDFLKFIWKIAHLIVPLSLSCAENALCGMGGQWDKTYIKAFTTLWF